ncbi:MAG TPA: hypothetical protein VMX33_00965 [bacterium]|nr:hypothetical protein [bacterium]
MGVNMGAHQSRRIMVISGIAIALVAAIVVSFVFVTRKPVLALYGLDDRETQAMRNLVGDTARLTVAAALPVAPARFPRADVIVARSGVAVRAESLTPLKMPDDILARTVPSLRRAVEIDGVPQAMPLFLDHFELAWNKDRFSSRGLVTMNSLDDMERALASWTAYRQVTRNALEKSTYAFAFAGGDDESLLLLLSALCVSEGGLSAYNVVTRSLVSGTPLDALAGVVIGTSADGKPLTLGAILDRLASWIKKGYMHPEWYALKDKDIRSMIEGNVAFMSAQLLSFHRSVDYNAIMRFASGRFPAASATMDRALVAPLTIAIVTASHGRSPKALDLVRAMTDAATAREAASTSGRSTTIAAATAPDIQAADALSFAAASSTVVSGWYRDAFADEAAAARFAAAVRARLRR